jgi:hypothetical protein
MKIHRLLQILFLICVSLHAPAQETLDLDRYRADAVSKWEEAIANFEALDQTETHPADSILFIGSSSIRRWNTIADHMAPYHPIQRGFGGSTWSDVAVFADRLIAPHKFRAVVFFVGNDIVGRDTDKSPEEVVALFSYVQQRVRAHNPDAPVFYVSVTPTPSRWAVWPKTRKANSAIREFCQGQQNTWFIGTESIYLDANGQPRHELFVEDKLHLNPDGYIRWSAAIKSHLDSVLDGPGC